MLKTAFRSANRHFTAKQPLTHAPQLLLRMSTPTDPSKRALSTSPGPSAPSGTSPIAKKIKTDIDASSLPSAAPIPVPASEITATTIPAETSQPKPKPAPKQAKGRKGRKGASKPHKPGGAEETGYFDVVELLGKARVEEMVALEEAEVGGRNWRRESEEEWGHGAEGKDVEVEVVGMSAHGQSGVLSWRECGLKLI